MDTVTGFWDSDEGKSIRAAYRQESALHLDFELEAPSKRARRGTRRAASQIIQSTFHSHPAIMHAGQRTRWPRPKAALALDISAHSTTPNAPRIDNVCKWLLDEFTGLAYADDSQVKLLFARLWRPSPARTFLAQSTEPEQSFWSNFPIDFPGPVGERSPTIYATIQSRTDVLANLRTVTSLDARWEALHEYENWAAKDPVDAMLERDFLEDYRASLNPGGTEFDRKQHILTGRQLDFRDQAQLQRAVDQIFSSIMTQLSVDRFGLWRNIPTWLDRNPYIFNLGPLAKRGGSDAFQARLRIQLNERRRQFPQLFPLRATSGISMVLFEETGHSKDLDNLVRESLPAIVDVLRPPTTDLPGWIADEADPATGAVDVPFVEVISIPAEKAAVEPGTVVFGLSNGNRGSSWWHKATEYLYESIDR